MEKTIDLSPDKEVYKSAAVDVDTHGAIMELIDNTIDNWTRIKGRSEKLEIRVECNEGKTIVRDNSGGVNPKDLRILFALGVSKKGEIDGSIGAYGIGGKKAIVRLGKEAIIQSRKINEDVGYGFRITEKWMEDDQNWEVEVQEFEDIEEGETIIETRGLEGEKWNPERIDSLRESLSKAYELLLKGYNIPKTGGLEIKVNGGKIETPSDPDWSFTPFDGLHPRRFEDLEIEGEQISEPITMNVTVGLMRRADAQRAGTDIYCQGRKVIESNKGSIGGYGSPSKGKIGNFTSHNNRLKVKVELHTDGDASKLPWNAQKSDIDEYHPVTSQIHNYLRRIVRPYFKADTGKVPEAFVRPYDENHEFASNNGRIEKLDYGNRSRIKSDHKPSLSKVKQIREIAEEDAANGYIVENRVEPPYWEAYKNHVKTQADDVTLLDRVEEDEIEKIKEPDEKSKEETEEEKPLVKSPEQWIKEKDISKEIKEKAIDLTEEYKQKISIMAGSRKVLAAGGVYLAVRLLNIDLNQEEVADIFGTSSVSVRKAYKKIAEKLDIELSKEKGTVKIELPIEVGEPIRETVRKSKDSGGTVVPVLLSEEVRRSLQKELEITEETSPVELSQVLTSKIESIISKGGS